VAAKVAAVERAREAGPEQPQLLSFYSLKSGPCRRVEAFLSQVLQRRHNHETFRLVRICAERHPDFVERFAVDELPTIIVVAGRQVRARLAAPDGTARAGGRPRTMAAVGRAIASSRAVRRDSRRARDRAQALRSAAALERERSQELRDLMALRHLWAAPRDDLQSVLVPLAGGKL
jgi:hypothetical protein